MSRPCYIKVFLPSQPKIRLRRCLLFLQVPMILTVATYFVLIGLGFQ